MLELRPGEVLPSYVNQIQGSRVLEAQWGGQDGTCAESSSQLCERAWHCFEPEVTVGLSFPVCFQGPSQWVTLEFPQRIRVSQLQIQFQGGFSSRRGCLEGTGRPWKRGRGSWRGQPGLTVCPFPCCRFSEE